MIIGLGTDITEVKRFKKWVEEPSYIQRFFNEKEISKTADGKLTERQLSSLCQHYAVRFAAKEAFSKALGTGISGFELKDVYVQNEESGKPYLVLENSAKELFEKICGKANILVSLSHEKEYALATVIIEK
ncbi:holo-ACP synthase [Treponema sp.]|uniref:holo-ACP synthase n=1 Tax=Treponema sp. TaxID=166 RepID=UPI00298ED04C|nr:holo-ACP synthase [Treponema sp.]MCR5612272.1 holo-ACP synthase [Treponema sp.]